MAAARTTATMNSMAVSSTASTPKAITRPVTAAESSGGSCSPDLIGIRASTTSIALLGFTIDPRAGGADGRSPHDDGSPSQRLRSLREPDHVDSGGQFLLCGHVQQMAPGPKVVHPAPPQPPPLEVVQLEQGRPMVRKRVRHDQLPLDRVRARALQLQHEAGRDIDPDLAH